MITIRVTGKIPDFSKKLRQGMKDIADDVFTNVKSVTPVDTGYAKSRWTRQDSIKSTTINNNAPYISELEKGRSSQAPNGMLKPVYNTIKSNFNKGKYFK